MTIFMIVVIILSNLAAHELGHAIEMRRKGIRIESIGIGMPWLSVKIGYSRYFGCPIKFSPLLLGAYVMPVDREGKDTRSLSYNSQAMIYGSGSWMNLWLSIIFLAIPLVINGSNRLGVLIITAMVAVITPKKIFCRYTFPVLGIVFLVFLGYEIASSLVLKHSLRDVVGGPVTIVNLAYEFSSSWSQLCLFGMVISASIGIFNAMPFIPLDGGRSLSVLVDRFAPRAKKAFSIGGVICLTVLVIIAISNDILSFFK